MTTWAEDALIPSSSRLGKLNKSPVALPRRSAKDLSELERPFWHVPKRHPLYQIRANKGPVKNCFGVSDRSKRVQSPRLRNAQVNDQLRQAVSPNGVGLLPRSERQ
jgi:hypothetical protein